MKHGWNSLKNYLHIHEKVLDQYSKFMQFPKTYVIEKVTDNYYSLVCTGIHFNTVRGQVIRVDISKDVDIDATIKKRPQARTARYSYCASKPGSDGWCIIRYDSPHADAEKKGVPAHHKHHHRHDFRSGRKSIKIFDCDDWPHVSEFLSEVYNTL